MRRGPGYCFAKPDPGLRTASSFMIFSLCFRTFSPINHSYCAGNMVFISVLFIYNLKFRENTDIISYFHYKKSSQFHSLKVIVNSYRIYNVKLI